MRPSSLRLRIFTAATLVVAAFVAVSVAPAAAATSSAHATYCDPLAQSPLNSLAALVPQQGEQLRAGGKTIRREPDRRGIADSSEFKGGKSVTADFTATIPVYLHVITDGADGQLTPKQIADQITVLNLTFGGFYGGADTGFRFTLAGVDTTNNPAWFAGATFEDEVAMKTALKRGGPTDLDIYSTSGAGFLGFAYLPKIAKDNHYSVLDGIVMHWGSVPGGFIEGFNLGYTAVHEAGHWLGLLHTFDQGCIGHGDYVDDTPYEATPTSGCPEGKDTCTRGVGLDPIHNYMDYSDDPCYTQFTPGQAARMQAQYLHWRVNVAG
jgi:hypothetical protein